MADQRYRIEHRRRVPDGTIQVLGTLTHMGQVPLTRETALDRLDKEVRDQPDAYAPHTRRHLVVIGPDHARLGGNP